MFLYLVVFFYVPPVNLEVIFIYVLPNSYIFYNLLYFSTLRMSILPCFINSDYQLWLTGIVFFLEGMEYYLEESS